MNTAICIKMDNRDPDLSRIREIARGCRGGKIAAFPTETVYGIGGPMSVRGTREKLAAIKGRSVEKPFSYHIGEWDMIDFLGVQRSPAFHYLTRSFWPGPLTILILNRQGEKIGLRFPAHRIAVSLINATGEPFMATSANRSGEPSPFSGQQVMETLGHNVDYLIDAGFTDLREDSTIVDVSGENPEIVREGAMKEKVRVAVAKIRSKKFIRKRVLIVCTGNSCRSPMAEGWLKAELIKHGLQDEIEVTSCGVSTRSGMPSTAEAIYVMKNREIDISGHRSRFCTREDIMAADIIVAMGKEHNSFITGLVPSAREKIRVFGIKDPIGSSMSVYEEVMQEIQQKVDENWEWIVA